MKKKLSQTEDSKEDIKRKEVKMKLGRKRKKKKKKRKEGSR